MGKLEHQRENLEKRKRERQEANHQVENSEKEVMSLIHQPHFLHELFTDSLIESRDKLDRLWLPESLYGQFFLNFLNQKIVSMVVHSIAIPVQKFVNAVSFIWVR